MKSPILFSSLTLGGMDDQHPNLQMVTGVVDQLSGTRSLVRQLYLKGNEHLCRVKTIYREKNASFPVVMTEMKQHATDVIKDLLAIEMSLLHAIENAEVWMSSTGPLSAPPSRSHDSAQGSDRKKGEYIKKGVVEDEFRIGMLVNRSSTNAAEILSHAVVVGYHDGQVLVCDQSSSTTVSCDPCTLTRSPMFEADFIISETRKRRRATLENSVSMKASKSLAIIKSAVTQLNDDADALTAFRSQVEAEESWVRETSSQLESSYYFMKSKAADLISCGPLTESDVEKSKAPLLLENGPSPKRSIAVDSDTSNSGDDGRREIDEILEGNAPKWSAQRMAAGTKLADELQGDLVLMVRRGEKYFGRMGVVVQKGVIVDDGRIIHEVRLLERTGDDPLSLFMVTESLHFAVPPSERRI